MQVGSSANHTDSILRANSYALQEQLSDSTKVDIETRAKLSDYASHLINQAMSTKNKLSKQNSLNTSPKAAAIGRN